MRIGLIAMSGIRIVNPELLSLGLTLPGFVERGRVIASLPSLALLTVAGMTPKEHEVVYMEVDDIRRMGDLPLFDVVAISTYTAQAYEAYELADRYRSAGTRVILGGLHCSMVPDEAEVHADAVVVGEAELVWAQVIADLEAGTLSRRYDAFARGPCALQCSPVPRYDLLDPTKYNRITIQTHRGCPIDCEFCGASILLGKRHRQKSVPQIVRELEAVRAVWKAPFIEFADDNTFVNKSFGKKLCRALAPYGIKWFTESDLSIASDPELLESMAESGCRQVLIGLESVMPTSLDGMDRRNWKFNRRRAYKEAIAAIQSFDITVNACMILGLDGDDETVFEKTYDFLQESGAYDCQVTILTPFPGTRLLTRMESEGRLLFDRFWDRCTLFDAVFRPKRMSVDDLESGFRWLISKVYSPESIDARRAIRKEHLRSARHAARIGA